MQALNDLQRENRRSVNKLQEERMINETDVSEYSRLTLKPGGALGYFLGGYVPPGTSNWHPVLKKISPKIDTPF